MWESRIFMKINNRQLTAELKPEPSESEFLLGRITLSLLLLTKKPTAYLSLLHGEEAERDFVILLLCGLFCMYHAFRDTPAPGHL